MILSYILLRLVTTDPTTAGNQRLRQNHFSNPSSSIIILLHQYNLHQPSFPSDHPTVTIFNFKLKLVITCLMPASITRHAISRCTAVVTKVTKLVLGLSQNCYTNEHIYMLTQKIQTVTIVVCQLSRLRNIAAAGKTNQRQCSRQRIIPIIEVWKIVKCSLPGRPLLTPFLRPSILPPAGATEWGTEHIVSPPSIGFPFVSIHNVTELQFTEMTGLNCNNCPLRIHYIIQQHCSNAENTASITTSYYTQPSKMTCNVLSGPLNLSYNKL